MRRWRFLVAEEDVEHSVSVGWADGHMVATKSSSDSEGVISEVDFACGIYLSNRIIFAVADRWKRIGKPTSAGLISLSGAARIATLAWSY